MRSTSLDESHDFLLIKSIIYIETMGHLEVTGPKIDFSRFDPMNLYSFLRGFSQCRRRIHSSTQMMGYIDFSKSRFFDFFLD